MPRRRRGFTEKEWSVLNYYYGPANLDKTKALRMAGYSCPEGYLRFFDKRKVKDEMARREQEVQDRYDVTYDKLIREMAKIAFSSLADYGRFDEASGDFIFKLGDADPDELAALGEITVETYLEGRGEDAQEVKRVRVKPYNKLGALEALMKHAGLSKDKLKIEGEVNLVDRIVAARKRVGGKAEDDSSS